MFLDHFMDNLVTIKNNSHLLNFNTECQYFELLKQILAKVIEDQLNQTNTGIKKVKLILSFRISQNL